MNTNQLIPVASMCALLFTLACSPGEDDEGGSDGGPDTVEWEIGPSTDYAVEGDGEVEIDDPVSGLTFVFPQGGNGTLSVAPIVSGPAFEYESTQVHISYSGEETVYARLAHNEGDYDTIYSFRELEGTIIDDGSGGLGWWPVHDYEPGSASYLYTLNVNASTNASSPYRSYTPPPVQNFSIASFPAGSTQAELLDSLRTTIWEVIEVWLENLPTDVAETARTNINTTLTFSLCLTGKSWITGEHYGSYYGASNSVLWNAANFAFGPADGNTVLLRSVAHEVGHYLCHVLLGYDRYTEMVNNFRTGSHAPGEYYPRAYGTIEDYAYLSEYMITDAVNDIYVFSNVQASGNFATATQHASPAVMDYPGHEGFTAAIWISLMRWEGSIYTFDASSSSQITAKVPVINATMPQVIELILGGPRTVDEARSQVQDFLESLGSEHQFLLPAILEPLGWSYNGEGKVLDTSGSPVAGCILESVSQAGGTTEIEEYKTVGSITTGEDGKFYIQRMYPGDSIVRANCNYNSNTGEYDIVEEFPFNIDWSDPTNETQDIGDLVLEITSPHIDDITPSPATAGSTIVISGANFGATQGSGSFVQMGGGNLGVSAWSDTEISCALPATAQSGQVSVTVGSQKSNEVYLEVGAGVPWPTSFNLSELYVSIRATIDQSSELFGSPIIEDLALNGGSGSWTGSDSYHNEMSVSVYCEEGDHYHTNEITDNNWTVTISIAPRSDGDVEFWGDVTVDVRYVKSLTLAGDDGKDRVTTSDLSFTLNKYPGNYHSTTNPWVDIPLSVQNGDPQFVQSYIQTATETTTIVHCDEAGTEETTGFGVITDANIESFNLNFNLEAI